MDTEYFSPDAAYFIKEEITRSGNNEVFFAGSMQDDGKVCDVRVVSRGNKYSVPAILEAAEFEQVVIHNHPSGNLTPSEADIEVASAFGNNGVGFYIVNNDLSDVYVVVEAFRRKEYEKLDLRELGDLFTPEGPIASELGSRYEYREEQIAAMNNIAGSFNGDGISIVEAGTGTGKTLSYLVPSVYWSVANNERVVISTNTINLQEQLADKDIPLLQHALDKNFRFSLVKGMKNYLCLLRLDTVNDGLFDLADSSEEESLSDIREWAKTTSDGSLSDLGFVPSEDLWDKVSAESESCLRVKCPHYSNCFYFKARREMSRSQLIIANHHMFFSDLSIKAASNDREAGIIPRYNRVVFDEAHNVVDAATSHFSLRASKFGLIRTLRRLKSRGNKGEPKGLVFYAASNASKLPDELQGSLLYQSMLKTEEIISPRTEYLEDLVRDGFDYMYEQIRKLNTNENGYDINVRVTRRTQQSDGWEDVEKKFRRTKNELDSLVQEIGSFAGIMEQYESKTDLSRLIAEFRGVYNRLSYYSEVMEAFFYNDDEGNVKWFEGRKGKNDIVCSLGVSPIEISEKLKSDLYSRCNTIVMTSATLAVKNNFNFQKRQLGLESNKRVSELVVDSSFNFGEQAMMAIPEIASPGESGYKSDLYKFISSALEISGGHALVLFTSYSLLNEMYSKLAGELDSRGILLLKQGSLPRNRLLEKFRKNSRSVLFATNSFWEGVDIPGDALRMVILTRLPFRVPSDPMIEARVEYLEKQGINSFMEYSLPVAILRFKQGFGRLIRSGTDSGVVAILDSRIRTKSYGRDFLNSLPECMVAEGDREAVLDKISEFLKNSYGSSD